MRNGLNVGLEQDDGMADRKNPRFENRLRTVATTAVVSDPIRHFHSLESHRCKNV